MAPFPEGDSPGRVIGMVKHFNHGENMKRQVMDLGGMLAGNSPFSFMYGGLASANLLPAWPHEEKKEAGRSGRALKVMTYTDPVTRLEVRYELMHFEEFSAFDWTVTFTNTGTVDSPVLNAVLPLDLRLCVPAGDVVLHHAKGSTCSESDFLPVDQTLEANVPVNLAPNGGCSSDGVLPFFNMAWSGGGLAWAIGWSGQWAQQVQQDFTGRVELKAGQQTFRAKLRPGESIRTPRILLVPWQGSDRMSGHNLLRQAILAHYTPRLDGELVMPPIAQNTWFINNCGNETTEENQLKHIHAMPALGVETFWLDAGWHEGGWPKGIGSWVPKAEHFPRGLKPLGDAAHQLGLNFLLWLAPELVSPGTRIAREHPEFVLAWKDFQKEEGLFNVGDPVARAWLTDYLSTCITEWGVDIWRTDFGGKPLLYWQKKDESDRQGITENHYITGLYAMYDELHRRHPRLIFDDCASGGRRIDLELISRCYVLFRSDTPTTSASTSAWDQAQTAGLSLYVPVHATGSSCGIPRWSSQALSLYALRSSETSGFGVSQNNFAPDFPHSLFKKVIDEVKTLRPLYTGNFYPLTEINTNEDAWCAWQFNRPDLGQGFAMFFRRPESPYAAREVVLRELEPDADYEVMFVDSARRSQQLTGAELTHLKVEILSAPDSLLVMYRKVK